MDFERQSFLSSRHLAFSDVASFCSLLKIKGNGRVVVWHGDRFTGIIFKLISNPSIIEGFNGCTVSLVRRSMRGRIRD